MANRQGSLNLGFTISLPAPNLEYVALVSIWTSMPNSQVRGYTQVRRFSRLAKEFQVPRLPNFPVPRFKKGPRFPGSLSPVSTPVTNKSPALGTCAEARSNLEGSIDVIQKRTMGS